MTKNKFKIVVKRTFSDVPKSTYVNDVETFRNVFQAYSDMSRVQWVKGYEKIGTRWFEQRSA